MDARRQARVGPQADPGDEREEALPARAGRIGGCRAQRRENRHHVDRRGCPVYVVTDFYTLNAATAEQIRENEAKAFAEKLRRRKEESP